MGAIADAIVDYARPLIDSTDGSLEQMNKALSMSQACWNLAILPAEQRQAAIEDMKDAFQMDDVAFDDFHRSILRPMIHRHEKMFPGLHQRSSLAAPHWESAFQPPRKSRLRLPKPVQPAPEPPPLLSLDDAFRELEEASNVFPERALRFCQANREAAIPRLLEVLERTIKVGQDGAVPLGNATIFALFLLAEFQVAEAIPIIWRFLKLPHDIPDEILSDSITEDLPRILAIFSGSRLDLLDELIVDPALNRWVRNASAHACGYLVRDGLLSRQDAILWLQKHLTEAIRRRDASLTDPLISSLIDLNANEARPEIELAFQEGLVNEEMVDLERVNEELSPDSSNECNMPPHHAVTAITDTVEELRGWNWQDETLGEVDADDFDEDDWLIDRDEPPLFDSPYDDATQRYSTTIRVEGSRTGRNDPCHCGSGKKYKKCCLRRDSNGSL